MPRPFLLLCAIGAAMLLTACKVEANKETIPEAEGSGKSAVNIRVQPMTKEEIKDATGKVIDKSAEVAGEVKDAASSLNQSAKAVVHNATTATDSVLPANTPSPEPSASVIATPAEVIVTTTTVPVQ